MSPVTYPVQDAMVRAMTVVNAEILHQDTKWGKGRILTPGLWIAILGEEFGEVCKATLERKDQDYIDELADVAATAIQAIVSALLEADAKQYATNTTAVIDFSNQKS